MAKQCNCILFITIIVNVLGQEDLIQITQDLPMQSSIDAEPDFEGIITNVTYPIGREAILVCAVKNLGRFKVGWLRAADQTVLALQNHVVSHNTRISVIQEDTQTYKLRIRQLRESDKGCYMCQINTSPMKKQIGCIDVNVPPDIINEESSADIAVQEGEDAILTCHATGNPTPRVIWRREDNEAISLRKTGTRELIKAETVNGSSLRLVRLDRRQMGVYFCIASNDVPPAVSKRVSLSVHFLPSVRAGSQLLGAPLGSNVHLECQVEASPVPVTYWLKGGQTINNNNIEYQQHQHHQQRPEMILDGIKYGITEEVIGHYRSIMRLVVRSFSPNDIGTYHCVSTNSLGRAEGTMRIYEIKINEGDFGGGNGDDDQTNIIGGLAEPARGRATSNAAYTINNISRGYTFIILILLLLLFKLNLMNKIFLR